MQVFMLRSTFVFSIIFFSFFPFFGWTQNQTQTADLKTDPPFSNYLQSNWVDSVLNTLTTREKIAQLIMVAAYSNKDEAHAQFISSLITEYKIGGLIFMQGGPIRQAQLANRYQKLSKIPLMISIDGEWGLAMRLDSTISYPRQQALGSIQNNELIFKMGQDIGEQCRRLGIHINFAPVVDVNVNAANPVINSRSFGENVANVSQKGVAYMQGMQSKNVMATSKHFPGHGDTNTDSHKDLPTINHSFARLDSVELAPFRALINAGLASTMVAHLNVPGLDSVTGKPTTLSNVVVDSLLKKEYGFKGLIFTDALNMQGVAKFYKPGEVDALAFKAGNDILLFSGDVKSAIDKIENKITNGLISIDELNARVRKVLASKQWFGLTQTPTVELNNLYQDLNKEKYLYTKQQLINESITLVKNTDSLLPITKFDSTKIAYVNIGKSGLKDFQNALMRFASVTQFYLPKSSSVQQQNELIAKLKNYNRVIIGVHATSQYPFKKYGDTPQSVEAVQEIAQQFNATLVYFGNPYGLAQYNLGGPKSILLAYHDEPEYYDATAQIIFGALPAKGKLSVSISNSYTFGSGETTDASSSLKFGSPFDVGIDPELLNKIDEIAVNGINEKAYPGCQILVAKKGTIIYNKSFGNYTYEKLQPVTEQSIYDLASITKIASTLLAFMQLDSEGKVNLDQYLCDYLPDLVNNTPYEHVNIREMLAHQARLPAWIPFYTKTMTNGQLRFDIYSTAPSYKYPFRVAENLYIVDYKEQIFQSILKTPLRPQKQYLYSDLGYYFLKEIIEKVTQIPLNEYVAQNFYQPMGLATTGYLPLHTFEKEQIVPTEHDVNFRKQLVQGDVHDPGAAMLGGVGGHAGLFSNAIDLAKLMQMYINNGQYNGVQYIKEDVVQEYSKCQFCAEDNRRGAGFDKPVRDGEGGPTCQCVSLSSFGHSGFTGTLTWADPDEDLVYVFLSNRVHPNAENKKLITLDIRTNIMQAIYDAINSSKDTSMAIVE